MPRWHEDFCSDQVAVSHCMRGPRRSPCGGGCRQDYLNLVVGATVGFCYPSNLPVWSLLLGHYCICLFHRLRSLWNYSCYSQNAALGCTWLGCIRLECMLQTATRSSLLPRALRLFAAKTRLPHQSPRSCRCAASRILCNLCIVLFEQVRIHKSQLRISMPK